MATTRYKVHVVKRDKDYDLIRYFNDYDKAEAYFKRQHNYDFTVLIDQHNNNTILLAKGELQNFVSTIYKKDSKN